MDNNNETQSWLAHPFTKKLVKHCKEELERRLVFDRSTLDQYQAGYLHADCKWLHLIINPAPLKDLIKYNEENND